MSAVLRRLPRLTSINEALSIDLSGQIAADAVAGRQHSGAGGHKSFVSGARAASDGQSFSVLGPPRTSGTPYLADCTPIQRYVVTEHGAVDLSLLGDTQRPRALIEIAHPDFRDWLRTSFA
ncbi:MAG: acetyl-CoA hydrolase/transferase C-terminal domain-containing protein [Gammaproteobacteria bacterium]